MTAEPHPQRCDWVEEVRIRCYSYTEFYGGERVIRFDELEGVIQQIKEERKVCASTAKSEWEIRDELLKEFEDFLQKLPEPPSIYGIEMWNKFFKKIQELRSKQGEQR